MGAANRRVLVLALENGLKNVGKKKEKI